MRQTRKLELKSKNKSNVRSKLYYGISRQYHPIDVCVRQHIVFRIDDEHPNSPHEFMDRVRYLIDIHDEEPLVFYDSRKEKLYDHKMDDEFHNHIAGHIFDIPDGKKKTVLIFAINGKYHDFRASNNVFVNKLVVTNYIEEKISSKYRDKSENDGDGYILWAFDISGSGEVTYRYAKKDDKNISGEDKEKNTGQNSPMHEEQTISVQVDVACFSEPDRLLISDVVAHIIAQQIRDGLTANEIAAKFRQMQGGEVNSRSSRSFAEPVLAQQKPDPAGVEAVVQSLPVTLITEASREACQSEEAAPSPADKTALALPEKAPELFDESKEEDAITFYWRIWGKYAEAGLLYQFMLTRYDKVLMNKIRNLFRRKDISKELKLPPRQDYTTKRATDLANSESDRLTANHALYQRKGGNTKNKHKLGQLIR